MNKFASIALSLALALTALAPAAASAGAATTTTAGASTATPAAKTTQMRGWHRVCNQYRCWWVRTYYAAAQN
jgi:hypothetical protein